jgi:hypothetical protein
VKMLLHSAAALHGHEYSPPSEQTQQARCPLVRSAFSTPMMRLPSATSFEKAIPLLQRSVRSISEYTPRPTVHFKDPTEPDTMSDSGRSVDSSIENSGISFGSAAERKKKQRRSLRARQNFVFAIPAPTLTSTHQHMIHIRPRNLLQLQMVPANGVRVVPVMDVRVGTRVAKYPKGFRAKGHLSNNSFLRVLFSSC